MLAVLSGFITLLTVAQIVSAQVPFPGPCPNVTYLEEFDLEAYLGIWYEYSKYPFTFEIGKKCMYATYEAIDNETISVVNSAINRFTNRPSNVTGKARALGPGQLAVTFSRNQRANKPNYIVLGTDYTHYAVVYSCTNFTPIAHIKIVWILTRDRLPNEEVVAAAKKVLDANKISQIFLIETIQNDKCRDPGNATDVESWTETEISLEMGDGDDDVTTTMQNLIDKA